MFIIIRDGIPINEHTAKIRQPDLIVQYHPCNSQRRNNVYVVVGTCGIEILYFGEAIL
jgi:hypothetical protein